MATNNSVNVGLSGSTGSGQFVGASSPTITTPTLSGNSVISGGTLSLTNTASNATITATTSTTGSTNEASLVLKRGDQANGYAQTHFYNSSTDTWNVGLRAGSASLYHRYVPSSLDAIVVGTAGELSFVNSITNTFSTAGSTLQTLQYQSNNSNGGSHSTYIARVGGASGGDPSINLDVSGVGGWSMGLDNSDSDKLKWDYGNPATVGGATKLTLDSSGNLNIAGALTTGSFSVNSFTPAIQDSSGHSYSMTRQTGTYIQIGQLYLVWIWIEWNGKGSAVSGENVRITGFPAAPTVGRAPLTLGSTHGLGITTQASISSDIDVGLTYAWIWRNVTGTASLMTVAQTGTTGELQMSGFYY